MEPELPEHFSVSQRFNDFDAFNEAAAGWDLDFRQMDRGRFEAKLSQIATPSVILAECAFNRRLEQRGATPAGYRTFGIPAGDALNLLRRGKEFGPDDLLLFPNSAELDSVSNVGFHVFAFSVSERVLEQAAERRGLSSVEEMLPRSDLVKCPRSTLSRLKNLASRLSRSAQANPGLVTDSSFLESLESELVAGVLDAAGGGDPVAASRGSAKSRSQAVKKALEIIADHATKPITVAEVEKVCGASGRTLRYGFEETFGLSPKQYLQNYRLNGVHQTLLRSRSTDTKVADATNEWGFWHMGQFAADFRNLFGELPSETLAKYG